ncbi:PREDICTED: leucine-rich repeat-containing protein 14 [Nanorana parkeri]|uniref:leucine-rich repeat-containing protein 14 n=1 Tax=Nanorana parkeri TaxID=125878 RepID=UPI00085420C9|nr:PREDICTED: leucine-rich repeat-containing protein 14 [Nanorana parkeri]XP_018429492.1 PREDICTED: leucine-rich repeat-containing protein 14 [Nanorana parkeri]
MLSLVCVCAQKVVSDHASLLRTLDSIPRELYPTLFTAAFLGRKTLVLQDLVQRWPFTILSFQELLRGDNGQLHHNPSRMSTQTVILGVMAYLSDALSRENGAERGRRLRLLDMTGAHDAVPEQGPDSMSLWSRTVTLAKACIKLSKRCRHKATQAAKRRRGHEDSALAPPASLDSVYVEVRVDLFVNSTSYSVLQEAVQVSARGPLRLRCRDLRAEELSLRNTVELLELLDPAGLRQIDLRFNNLGLGGLNALLPTMVKFSSLRSLKLPYSNIDVRRLTSDTEDAMRKFATLIGQLRSLKELNLGSSRLSGHLRQLLGGIQEPLESLELAFCFLLPADLYYLSQSPHAATLKKVDLSGNNLSELLLPPFQQLLAAVSSSLLHLDVMECKLNDSALSALVPALCRCSRLQHLGLCCNPLSSQGLRTLLQNCAWLRELRLVVYPCPVDCYSDVADWVASRGSPPHSFVGQEKLALFSAELQVMLARAERTDIVWTMDMRVHRNLDYLSL